MQSNSKNKPFLYHICLPVLTSKAHSCSYKHHQKRHFLSRKPFKDMQDLLSSAYNLEKTKAMHKQIHT